MAEDEQDFTPPEGFVRLVQRGPFTEHNGPIYGRVGEEGAVQGFLALGRHANSLGIVHGGMMGSFLDTLLGQAVSAASKKPAVTIHLSLDYLSMARVGDWIEGRAAVTRLTRDVAFAEGQARVGTRAIVRATGVFKLMAARR